MAPHLDWNLKTGGYGSVVGYPAKFSFDIAASNCTDEIYFTVDQPGSASDRQRHRHHESVRAAVRGTRPARRQRSSSGSAWARARRRRRSPALTGMSSTCSSRGLRQRRRDSSRDQRRQHHDQSRHLQLHDPGLVERAHAGRADGDSDERAALPDHLRGRVEQSGVAPISTTTRTNCSSATRADEFTG